MNTPQKSIPAAGAIIPYYAAAAICFIVVSVLYMISASSCLGHYFQPHILAIIHLTALGWATLIIMGASNQLAPVLADNKLYNDKVPVLNLILMLVGLSILIPSFWAFSFSYLTYLGAVTIIIAFIIHAVNISLTFRKKRKNNIIAEFILTAHLWLIGTAVLGITLLLNLRYGFLPDTHLHYLKIHASIGMAGWFLQLVIGVSARLIPMFVLNQKENKKNLNAAYYLLNAGLLGLVVEGFIFHTQKAAIIFVTLIILSLAFYISYIRTCYKSAMRKRLDPGMKQTFIALTLLLLPTLFLLLAIISREQTSIVLVKAYGFAYFAGFITIIIMGQTFKTLPYIIWMHITKPDQLPETLPGDLYSKLLVSLQGYIYLPGFTLFLLGILLKNIWLLHVGATLMTIAAILYCTHVFLTINKLKRKWK